MCQLRALKGGWGSLLVDLGDEVEKLGHDGGGGVRRVGNVRLLTQKEGESEIRVVYQI